MAKRRSLDTNPNATEPGEKTQIIRANIHRTTEKSPSFASLYANDVQVQITPWDVRLILGEIASMPTAEDPNVLVRQVGELRLSPQLAKKLTMILAQQLQGYEQNVGPIPIPLD